MGDQWHFAKTTAGKCTSRKETFSLSRHRKIRQASGVTPTAARGVQLTVEKSPSHSLTPVSGEQTVQSGEKA